MTATVIHSTNFLVRVTRNVRPGMNPWQDYNFADLSAMWAFVERERRKPDTRRIVVYSELQQFDITH